MDSQRSHVELLDDLNFRIHVGNITESQLISIKRKTHCRLIRDSGRTPIGFSVDYRRKFAARVKLLFSGIERKGPDGQLNIQVDRTPHPNFTVGLN